MKIHNKILNSTQLGIFGLFLHDKFKFSGSPLPLNEWFGKQPSEPMILQLFLVQQPLDPMVLQWFSMHWSNDGMVTIHRYGLTIIDSQELSKMCKIIYMNLEEE